MNIFWESTTSASARRKRPFQDISSNYFVIWPHSDESLAPGCWGVREIANCDLCCASLSASGDETDQNGYCTCSQRCKNIQNDGTHGKASNTRICALVVMARGVQSNRKPHLRVVSCPCTFYRLLRRVLRWPMSTDTRQGVTSVNQKLIDNLGAQQICTGTYRTSLSRIILLDRATFYSLCYLDR